MPFLKNLVIRALPKVSKIYGYKIQKANKKRRDGFAPVF